MIDIVDIKILVREEKLQFFLKDNYIYAKDLISGEQVIVGQFEEEENTVFSINSDVFTLIKKEYKPKKIEEDDPDE